MDDEVIVDIYSETEALTFVKSAAKVPIFEYSIVCEVSPKEEPAKRGSRAKVTITKQQLAKITKQMEDAGKQR